MHSGDFARESADEASLMCETSQFQTECGPGNGMKEPASLGEWEGLGEEGGGVLAFACVGAVSLRGGGGGEGVVLL